MEERFLKERYEEWAYRYEFDHPAVQQGKRLFNKTEKACSRVMDALVTEFGKKQALQIENYYSPMFLDYIQAGFYAGYEMACYMFHNMIQDSPLSKSDRDRWNSIVTLSNVNQYYQKHGRMPNTLEELNQWIKDRGETNHEHA